jgi:MscS family membrane protein
MDINQIAANITSNIWLQALLILVAFFFVSKIAVWIAEKIFLKLAKKTKTIVDDLIVEKINKPISFLLFFIGIKLALIPIPFRDEPRLFLNNIIGSFLIIVGIYIIVGVLDIIIDVWGKGFAQKTKSTMDDHVISLLHKSVKVGYFIAILLMVLSVWGVEIGPMLASLGIAGLAVAFALQSTLANIFGGISMILDKNIKVGDVIVIDETTKGKVIDIGLRSTKMKTFDNEFVIVPNSNLADNKLQNIAKPDPSIRVIIPFGVEYGSKIEKVKTIVLKELEKIEGLDLSDEDKEPSVKFLEMGDSALMFKAYFWMKDYKERVKSIDEANTLIYNTLNKHGIGIPFPQMDVHIRRR